MEAANAMGTMAAGWLDAHRALLASSNGHIFLLQEPALQLHKVVTVTVIISSNEHYEHTFPLQVQCEDVSEVIRFGCLGVELVVMMRSISRPLWFRCSTSIVDASTQLVPIKAGFQPSNDPETN